MRIKSIILTYNLKKSRKLLAIYLIRFPKNFTGSPWRDKISLAILELQEKGEIQILYDKWWKSPGDTCMKTEKGKENKANSLGVDNIGERLSQRIARKL